MGLFGGKSSASSTHAEAGRIARHSSGWQKLSAHLKSQESLRILDIGPTSAGNINFTTNLGHSIYMANLVEDAARPEFKLSAAEAASTGHTYDVDRFLREALDFAGRTFDVVAFWDTADYLPAEFLQPVVDRIYDVMEPGGQLLAFFHSKMTGDDTVFSRYHLTDTDQIQMQRIGGHNILQTYTNRQIEALFARYDAYKFFLAKDSLREVIVTR
jgi:2-polyprenyl-3-methyl-5-hydroxy-6-metoxy-1,4-benzoquinol methylase